MIFQTLGEAIARVCCGQLDQFRLKVCAERSKAILHPVQFDALTHQVDIFSVIEGILPDLWVEDNPSPQDLYCLIKEIGILHEMHNLVEAEAFGGRIEILCF